MCFWQILSSPKDSTSAMVVVAILHHFGSVSAIQCPSFLLSSTGTRLGSSAPRYTWRRSLSQARKVLRKVILQLCVCSMIQLLTRLVLFLQPKWPHVFTTELWAWHCLNKERSDEGVTCCVLHIKGIRGCKLKSPWNDLECWIKESSSYPLNPWGLESVSGYGGFARCRDELSGVSKGWRSPRPGTDCCSAGRDPVTCHSPTITAVREEQLAHFDGWTGVTSHTNRTWEWKAIRSLFRSR